MVVILFLFFLIFPCIVLASEVEITNFSSNSDPEWVQITNHSDNEIIIHNWAIRNENDNLNNQDSLVLSGCLSAGSYSIHTFNQDWLNDSGDTIYLYDSNKELVHQLSYTAGTDIPTPDSTNTCLFTPTSTPTVTPTTIPIKTSTLTPTSTSIPTKTPTPTPLTTNSPTPTFKIISTPTLTDKNLYKLDESATASAIFIPIEETSSSITPTISSFPTPSSLVLEDTTTTKKNYLALIFIISGGLLFISPLIINKLKKK